MTDLPPGVCRNDKNPNRPFYINREHPQTGRRTQQSFATVEEAEAARKQEDEAVLRRQEARNEERRQASKRNREERTEALASKRAADLVRHGNDCAIERDYTERLARRPRRSCPQRLTPPPAARRGRRRPALRQRAGQGDGEGDVNPELKW